MTASPFHIAMTILLTGAAGFVGMHTCERLLSAGHDVLGLDNLNAYYAPQLKRDRLAQLQRHPGFRFVQADVADAQALQGALAEVKPKRVIHLAAQAGVRYSIENPEAYGQSNLVGVLNILEACRRHEVEHLVYASSSSVYGGNRKMPFAEDDAVDHPVSLYAATKKANELMAHSYSHLYRLPTTGLRFFTVYGPWGRPDMAYYLFTKAILEGRAIDVFNRGQMLRDFTYIDDITEGIVRVLDLPPGPDATYDRALPRASVSDAPYRVVNIGNHEPVPLLDFIRTLEAALGVKATLNMKPMQAGDVEATYADTAWLREHTGFAPSTPLATGLQRFVDWYRDYYRAA
jgi:UDP-glucuronate 4-epimerase